MCPSIPREYSPASKEGEIFEVLSKLPESYYVFHSLSVVNIDEDGMEEHEGDFVVFEPSKGILCIEAKAGRVRYENENWCYGNGYVMKYGSPFKQASIFKHTIMDNIREKLGYEIVRKCKFAHAVWFPSIKRERFDEITLPPEAKMQLMIFKDDYDNIEKVISAIYTIDIKGTNVKTSLGANDVKMILDQVLAPKFDVISIAQMKQDSREMTFGRLLKEQVSLLNYLDEQDRAVINGMAGTGKTLMAVEKAKRHGAAGEKVLFLCYNRYLSDYLKTKYAYDNVEYYTIDGLACKLCNTSEPDLNKLNEVLENMYYSQNFPYKHIIIDEGQDFGQNQMEESEIISVLQQLVLDNDFNDGTFYIFYDKNQLVQGQKIPDYILEADCKLTLYSNCRNTFNIANTSARFLGEDKKIKIFESCLNGDTPEMYIRQTDEDQINAVNDCIIRNLENGIENIVILTCSTEAKSVLHNVAHEGVYKFNSRSYVFTTCRKYKGLEADAIILVDVDRTYLDEAGERIIYVATSRAKFRLSIVANLTTDDCVSILNKYGSKKNKKPEKSFATFYNSKYMT